MRPRLIGSSIHQHCGTPRQERTRDPALGPVSNQSVLYSTLLSSKSFRMWPMSIGLQTRRAVVAEFHASEQVLPWVIVPRSPHVVVRLSSGAASRAASPHNASQPMNQRRSPALSNASARKNGSRHRRLRRAFSLTRPHAAIGPGRPAQFERKRPILPLI